MRRVADHPLAVVVKHADLDDNSDPQRLAVLPPDVADRSVTSTAEAASCWRPSQMHRSQRMRP